MRRVAAGFGVLAFLMVGVAPARAHPGCGIGVGADGSVVFTDIGSLTIWRLEAGAEAPEALVRDRWTHDLHLGDDGTLFYEREVPRDGRRAARALHARTPDGRDRVLIEPTLDAGVFDGGPLGVDGAGNVYFTLITPIPKSQNITRIFRRAPDGTVSHFCGAQDPPFHVDGDAQAASFGLITDMTIAPDGTLYVLEYDRVRCVSPRGKVTTLASGLLDARPKDPPTRHGPSRTSNRLYGICVDEAGVVHVAYHAGRRVVRIEPDGATRTVYSSSRPWAPVGVATRDGVLYVLEDGREPGSAQHGPRVRRVGGDGGVETLVTIGE